MVVQCEVIYGEGLEGACEDDDGDGLPFCGDEGKCQAEEPADRVVHEIPP